VEWKYSEYLDRINRSSYGRHDKNVTSEFGIPAWSKQDNSYEMIDELRSRGPITIQKSQKHSTIVNPLKVP